MKMRARWELVLAITVGLTIPIILPRITEAEHFKWFALDDTARTNAAVTTQPLQDQILR
jgi:hypothetical protein